MLMAMWSIFRTCNKQVFFGWVFTVEGRNKTIIGHIIPKLKSVSLLFIGQLFDNDCTAYFNKIYIYII